MFNFFIYFFLINLDVPDRFGNPKVSIGLPDRPLKQRPRSASGNLDHSLIDQSVQSLALEEHAKLKREHVARKEKVFIFIF